MRCPRSRSHRPLASQQRRPGGQDDGDGKLDFPADPGCATADDVNEEDIPQCADGIDNDGDGLIDFPADPGCVSSLDDELDGAATDLGGAADLGVPDAGVDDAGAPRVRPDGSPPDPGGVPEASGCSCEVGGGAARSSTPFLLGWMLIALGWGLRRRLR